MAAASVVRPYPLVMATRLSRPANPLQQWQSLSTPNDDSPVRQLAAAAQANLQVAIRPRNADCSHLQYRNTYRDGSGILPCARHCRACNDPNCLGHFGGWFSGRANSISDARPGLFKIYCDTGLQPFIDVLESGHYASSNHGWLFNTEVRCNPAKRARYLDRRRFKFYRALGGSAREAQGA